MSGARTILPVKRIGEKKPITTASSSPSASMSFLRSVIINLVDGVILQTGQGDPVTSRYTSSVSRAAASQEKERARALPFSRIAAAASAFLSTRASAAATSSTAVGG